MLFKLMKEILLHPVQVPFLTGMGAIGEIRTLFAAEVRDQKDSNLPAEFVCSVSHLQ